MRRILASAGTKLHDFSKNREVIVRDTEKMTGKNAGNSPNRINLRIFSPNILTLALVDLPGLTNVPMCDQPRDVERQITDMLYKNNHLLQRQRILVIVPEEGPQPRDPHGPEQGGA